MTKPKREGEHATAINWESHIIANRIEDARFLMQHGHSLESAAARLGIPLDTLEKNMERSG